MFWNRYPTTKLVHPRVPAVRGRPRDFVILPKPFGRPPPEQVHDRSCVIMMPGGLNAMVIEWSGDVSERHLVEL